jgi:photosystem II stability/assembly factor-like uncharacterized protein
MAKKYNQLITQLVERYGMTRNHACQWRIHCEKEGRDLWSYGVRKTKPRIDPETLLVGAGPTVLHRTQAGWRIAAAALVDEYVRGSKSKG